MHYLGIDLAARFSAACLIDAEGVVKKEWVCDFGRTSKPATPRVHLPLVEAWAMDIARDVRTFQGHTADVVVLVEDVSHFMVNPKPAIRCQGVMLNTLYDYFLDVELVMGNLWQQHFGYKKKKGVTTKGWAKEYAASLGYEPSKELAGGKSSVDLRDAYLIALYLRDTLAGRSIPSVGGL